MKRALDDVSEDDTRATKKQALPGAAAAVAAVPAPPKVVSDDAEAHASKDKAAASQADGGDSHVEFSLGESAAAAVGKGLGSITSKSGATLKVASSSVSIRGTKAQVETAYKMIQSIVAEHARSPTAGTTADAAPPVQPPAAPPVPLAPQAPPGAPPLVPPSAAPAPLAPPVPPSVPPAPPLMPPTSAAPAPAAPAPAAPASTVVTMLVPRTKAGGLIGRGGSVITQLRNESGCRIKIASDAGYGNPADQRMVTLTGTPEQVRLAQSLINAKLQTVEERPSGGGGSGAYGGGGMVYGGGGGGRGRMTNMAPYGGAYGGGGMPTGSGAAGAPFRMSISNDAVGRIIGKGGSSINQIRAQSGARVQVAEREPGSTTRTVTITGTPQQQQMAQYLISLKMAGGGGHGGGMAAGAAPAGGAYDYAQRMQQLHYYSAAAAAAQAQQPSAYYQQYGYQQQLQGFQQQPR